MVLINLNGTDEQFEEKNVTNNKKKATDTKSVVFFTLFTSLQMIIQLIFLLILGKTPQLL